MAATGPMHPPAARAAQGRDGRIALRPLRADLRLVMSDATRSASPAGSVSALIVSVRQLAERFLALAMLEGRQAGLSLAWMLGLALLAAGLVLTGWLALLACAVLALVQNDILAWGWALSIAALLSFAGAGGLVLLAIQRSRDLLFPATRRQLGRTGSGADRHE